MKKRLLIACALVGLVIAAHGPALRGEFVWDDTALVLGDPLIRSWRLIPEQFQQFLFTDATPSNFYRPLQRLTYTLEYWVAAFRPAVFHATNISLHAAAAIMLFTFALAFLERYGVEEKRRFAIGSIAAIAWSLHPAHSAVVDYVAGRADSLAALFGFTGLLLATHALDQVGRASWKFFALAGIAFLASALSKESGLMFIPVALAFFLLRKEWVGLRRLIAALAFVVTIYFTLRSQAGHVEVPRLSEPAPAIIRPIIAARALAEYAGLLIAPLNLHMDRDVESHPWGLNEASLSATAWRELETLAGVALLGLLVVWMVRSRRRNPVIFVLLVFAGITYAPVCGLFPLNATAAEHWIYIPSAFVILALALHIAQLNNRVLYGALACASLWIAFLGTRSFYRAEEWKTQRTFFERTIAAGGDSTRMLINLAALEMNENHLDRADTLLHRVLAREPEQPFAVVNLAAVALKRNDFPSARAWLDRARRNPVTEAQAHEMTAVLDYKEHRKIDLLRLRLASRTAPPRWSIERRYVRALGETGNVGGAIAELRAVLRTESFRAESWQLLSAYLMQAGRASDAGQAIDRARELDVHLNERPSS